MSSPKQHHGDEKKITDGKNPTRTEDVLGDDNNLQLDSANKGDDKGKQSNDKQDRKSKNKITYCKVNVFSYSRFRKIKFVKKKLKWK